MLTTLIIVAVLGAAPVEAPRTVAVQCPACKGAGTDAAKPPVDVPGFDGKPVKSPAPCERCKGSGKVQVTEAEARVLRLKAAIELAVKREATFQEHAAVATDPKKREQWLQTAGREKAKREALEAELKAALAPPPKPEEEPK